MTLSEAAVALGISYKAAWLLCRNGRLAYYRYTSEYTIEPEDLEAFRRACRNRRIPRNNRFGNPARGNGKSRGNSAIVEQARREVLADLQRGARR